MSDEAYEQWAAEEQQRLYEADMASLYESDFGSLTASDAVRFFNPPSSPPESPWRDTTNARRPLTDEAFAACPPVDHSGRDGHADDREEQALQELLHPADRAGWDA
jgi:hypothetical protein